MEATIFGLLCLIIGSLVFAATVNARQQNLERLRQQTKKAKDNASTAQLAFESLALIGCDPKLLNLLARYWIACLNQAKSYSPQDAALGVLLDTARCIIKDTLTSETKVVPATSDGEIRRAQGCINKALTQLSRLKNNGQIAYEEIEKWTLYLRQRFVDVAVEAHIAQAERCVADNNRASAVTHYRTAQNELTQSKVHGPEKEDRIKQLDQLAKAIFSESTDSAGNGEGMQGETNSHGEQGNMGFDGGDHAASA